MDCRARGADLVVIECAKEQEFLTRLTKRPTWIGLHDEEEEEGKWKWVDGTPVNLKYWANRQPDNGDGDPRYGEEDCAHIRTSDSTLWNDASCRDFLPWSVGGAGVACVWQFDIVFHFSTEEEIIYILDQVQPSGGVKPSRVARTTIEKAAGLSTMPW
uniref:C-type lectin domain family 10 member A-like n=1 Tax=Maylandia zebra TaxID=106582 RepID=UPI000D314103